VALESAMQKAENHGGIGATQDAQGRQLKQVADFEELHSGMYCMRTVGLKRGIDSPI
jgi:hypothetical protein